MRRKKASARNLESVVWLRLALVPRGEFGEFHGVSCDMFVARAFGGGVNRQGVRVCIWWFPQIGVRPPLW